MASVLVVDDSAVDRRLAGGLLERQTGCAVQFAADGGEALRLMAEALPDAVLTDLNMIGMNGFELVAAIKANYPLVPVILMTARGSEEIAARALRHGAVSYVPKRRLASDLAPTLQRILRGADVDRAHSKLMHALESSESSFTLRNDPALIHQLVLHLQEVLRCLPLGDETERLRVGVAIEEALLNACFHGNLEMDGRAQSPEQIRRRMTELPYASRRIHIRAQINRDQAVFTIRDEGAGFAVADRLKAGLGDGDGGHGRGLVLMRSVMDEVRFNDAGNEATLIKRRAAPAEEIAVGTAQT